MALLASVSGSQVGLILAPPPSGAAVSKPAIVYLMGVGTTGIAPEYGAVIRNEAGAVEWSSLDNPLFIRTVAITDAHATPNTSIVAGRSIAVCPSITGTIKRNGGNAFSVITGFLMACVRRLLETSVAPVRGLGIHRLHPGSIIRFISKQLTWIKS